MSWFGLALALVVALLGCWYLLYRLMGDGPPGLGLVNAFGHGWGMLAIACMVVAAVRRAWITAGAALLLAVLILAQVHWPLPAGGESAQRMRVVTASLRSQNRQMGEAAARFDTLKPDILLVQESSDPDALLAAFLAQRPGWHVVRQVDLLIVSRWPLSVTRQDNEIFRARVAVPGGPISVWNIHAPKNYQRAIENRQYYLNLVDDIQAAGPGIAAGDFNASPWNEGYADVAAVMDDGFRRTRWTPGFTFPGRARRSGLLGPFVAIDHIFATRDLKPLDAFVAPASDGADHLPVVVDYALPAR